MEILRVFGRRRPVQRRYHVISDHIGRWTHIPARSVMNGATSWPRSTTWRRRWPTCGRPHSRGSGEGDGAPVPYSGYLEGGEKPLWDNHDTLLGWSIARDLMGDATAKADYRS